ncbi:MAG: YceI family protein [bacterium]
MKHVSWIAAGVLASALVRPAAAERFEIGGGDASLVKFESKAPVETFEGKTHAVSGTLDVDPAALGDTLAISVIVEMAKLDTGIALRNRDMRENHLHTDKFPHATFEGGKIVEGGGGTLTAGTTRRVTLAGKLTIHGVTKDVSVPVDLTWDGAASVTVGSEFTVALADYTIPRPQFLVMKLGEVQKVSVSLVAKRPEPAAAPAEAK